MPIVTFYNCDPKDAPRTTQGAHLGANAIITCGGKLLLERRRDSNTWGLIGGGCKKCETGRDAIARETFEASLPGLKLAFTKDKKLFPFSSLLEIGKVSKERLPKRKYMVVCRRGSEVTTATIRRFPVTVIRYTTEKTIKKKSRSSHT